MALFDRHVDTTPVNRCGGTARRHAVCPSQVGILLKRLTFLSYSELFVSVQGCWSPSYDQSYLEIFIYPL